MSHFEVSGALGCGVGVGQLFSFAIISSAFCRASARCSGVGKGFSTYSFFAGSSVQVRSLSRRMISPPLRSPQSLDIRKPSQRVSETVRFLSPEYRSVSVLLIFVIDMFHLLVLVSVTSASAIVGGSTAPVSAAARPSRWCSVIWRFDIVSPFL